MEADAQPDVKCRKMISFLRESASVTVKTQNFSHAREL